jgi:hypothetical protein
MEAISIGLILLGIVALCQNAWFPLYQRGFLILVAGWLGLTIWSHRRAVRAKAAEGNPQITIDGHPPIEVTITPRRDD